MVAVPAPNPAHPRTRPSSSKSLSVHPAHANTVHAHGFPTKLRHAIARLPPAREPAEQLGQRLLRAPLTQLFRSSTLQTRLSPELRYLIKNVNPFEAAGISEEGWACMKADVCCGLSLAAPRAPPVDLTQYINATVKNEQALFKLAKTLHLPLDGRPNQGRWVVGIMYFFISQTEASLRADQTWIWDLLAPLRRLAAARAPTRPVYCTPFEEAPILHMLHFIKFRNGTRNSRPTLARNLQITRSNTNWDVEDPEAWMDAFIVATMPPPTVDCISRPTMARNPVLGIGVTPPLLLSPSQPIHLFGMERSAV